MSTQNQTNGHAPNGTAAAPREEAWHDAVDAVVTRARKYYGKSLDNRITKARHYLLNDQIEIDGQFAFVPSETDPESHYTVSMICQHFSGQTIKLLFGSPHRPLGPGCH